LRPSVAEICLQAASLDGDGQFAGGEILGIEAEGPAEIGEQADNLREAEVVEESEPAPASCLSMIFQPAPTWISSGAGVCASGA